MLNDYPQLLYIQNWVAKFGYMYRDIQLIRTVMYIAMVLVIGVACFNIVSTLIMAVKDKQGDIAIMRTLGANNGFIKQIFIWKYKMSLNDINERSPVGNSVRFPWTPDQDAHLINLVSFFNIKDWTEVAKKMNATLPC